MHFNALQVGLVLSAWLGRGEPIAGTWPSECQELPERMEVRDHPPNSGDSIRPWMLRITAAIDSAESTFITPLLSPPDSAVEVVDRLWREDSTAVEWALASLTADGEWEGRWDNEKYGRYYSRVSGKAGPILYSLAKSIAPDWEPGLRAIRLPLEPQDEEVIFWHSCMALWPVLAVSGSAPDRTLVQGAFPAWLSLAYRILGGTYPLISRHHREVIRQSLSPELIDAVGLR